MLFLSALEQSERRQNTSHDSRHDGDSIQGETQQEYNIKNVKIIDTKKSNKIQSKIKGKPDLSIFPFKKRHLVDSDMT